nr:MAG TPA: hypothetical protein [Bacteriophage sp.]
MSIVRQDLGKSLHSDDLYYHLKIVAPELRGLGRLFFSVVNVRQ